MKYSIILLACVYSFNALANSSMRCEHGDNVVRDCVNVKGAIVKGSEAHYLMLYGIYDNIPGAKDDETIYTIFLRVAPCNDISVESNNIQGAIGVGGLRKVAKHIGKLANAKIQLEPSEDSIVLSGNLVFMVAPPADGESENNALVCAVNSVNLETQQDLEDLLSSTWLARIPELKRWLEEYQDSSAQSLDLEDHGCSPPPN